MFITSLICATCGLILGIGGFLRVSYIVVALFAGIPGMSSDIRHTQWTGVTLSIIGTLCIMGWSSPHAFNFGAEIIDGEKSTWSWLNFSLTMSMLALGEVSVKRLHEWL